MAPGPAACCLPASWAVSSRWLGCSPTQPIPHWFPGGPHTPLPAAQPQSLQPHAYQPAYQKPPPLPLPPGKAKYDPKRHALVWKLKKFPGESEATLTASVELIATTRDRKPWSRPPLSMSFQVGVLMWEFGVCGGSVQAGCSRRKYRSVCHPGSCSFQAACSERDELWSCAPGDVACGMLTEGAACLPRRCPLFAGPHAQRERRACAVPQGLGEEQLQGGCPRQLLESYTSSCEEAGTGSAREQHSPRSGKGPHRQMWAAQCLLASLTLPPAPDCSAQVDKWVRRLLRANPGDYEVRL